MRTCEYIRILSNLNIINIYSMHIQIIQVSIYTTSRLVSVHCATKEGPQPVADINLHP